MRMTTAGGPPGRGRLVPAKAGTGAFQRVRSLACFKEVHARLVEGWPIAEVARFIQRDRKEYQDVSHDGLKGILSKYRDTIPAAERAKPALTIDQVQAAQEVSDGLDELKEIQGLFAIQKKRIERGIQLEEKIGMPIDKLERSVQVAQGLLESSARLKQELGITQRQLGTLKTENANVEVKVDLSDPEVKKVLDDPKSRRKVLGAAQRLLSLAERGRYAAAGDAEAPAGPGDAVPAIAIPSVEDGNES